MSLKSKFSSEALRARTALGLTQQEVADAVSTSVRWYQHIEKGTFMPGNVLMLRLILFLGLDIEVFREEEEINVPVRSR